MKKAATVLTALAFALALVTAAACLLGKNAAPTLLWQPRGAVERTEAMASSIGDYEALEAMLYGQPDLGVHREPADPAGKLFWNAFLDSLSCEFTGDCYATERGVARDLQLQRLSFGKVTASLGDLSRELLEQRVQEAQDMSQIYDEHNEYREDVVMEVLCQAAEQILSREGNTETLSLTVNLVYEEGQWWIIPDQSLLNALSWGS